MTEPDAREGCLSTNAGDANSFFERVFDAASGELRLDRRGRFWEAVATAHREGAVGAGRCIAIIDVGFDSSLRPLQHNVHPASFLRRETVEPSGRHGSVVALLARTVAPGAELLLLDVDSPGGLLPAAVAEAIGTAGAAGADVINLSLEFPTDCEPQETSWIDLDLLTAPAPPKADFLAQVDAWIEHAEPYAGRRCKSPCEICSALAQVPPETLVVAASGNRSDRACPACVYRVVGAGFERSERIERDGVVFTPAALPQTRANMARFELAIEEPPGFLGTSFAAPLLSGFAALISSPSALAVTACVGRAMTPVLQIASLQATSPPAELPEDASSTLHEALLRVVTTMPDDHRHFDHEWTRDPCPLCSLLFVDWYDVLVSLLIAVGVPERAVGVARIAAVLAPDAASVSANRGLAALRMAATEREPALRRELYTEALQAYEKANRLAGGVASYVRGRAEAVEALAREG